MKSPLIEIDVSKPAYEAMTNLISIKFGNKESVQVNFSKLFILSEYIRDKYKYSDALNLIQDEIKETEKKLKINDEIIKQFILLIQNEKVSIPIEHYKDFYALSEYFRIPKFTAELDDISQKTIFKDLNFTIQNLLDYENSNNNLEITFKIKIENFLRERINECIKNDKFKELQIPTICRIVSQSTEKVDHNLLVDFILESAELRFVMFKFVEFQKLTDEKIDELINFFDEQEEYVKKKYLEYITFDLLFIKQMRNKYDMIAKELDKTKNNYEQTKNELKQEKIDHEQVNEELKKTRIKKEETNEELVQIKRELKQAKEEINKLKYIQVIVAGNDNYNQLGEKPNNKNDDDELIISPPLKLTFDSSLLRPYSVYGCHSVQITSNGSPKGIGYNENGRIISSLGKKIFDHFTDFCMKDGSGRQLDPVSVVCCGYGTLYMFSKMNDSERQLVLCDQDIKGGDPVFLDIGNHHPVALFGGLSHSATICSEGEVIFINRDSVKKSPETRIESVSLPNGEKASSVACCNDSVVVLSSNGRVFSSPVEIESCVLKFSEVDELKGKEIVCVSGTSKHVIVVSKEGRVFGRGSNERGKLGLGEGIKTTSSFIEISSLVGYEIRAAYAGYNHSLFETQEGKIFSCGSNKYGQLLLSSGPSDPVYSPTETTITGGSTFCIAGDCLSVVFIDNKPPPNIPNKRIQQYI